MLRFYGHFAEAYGTFWLGLMIAAVVGGGGRVQDLVEFLCFVAGAFGYAIFRTRRENSEVYALRDRVRVLEAQLAHKVFGDGGAP